MCLPNRNCWIGALALAAVFAFRGPVTAQVAFASSADVEDVTYAADIADIIQNNCTVCHRPGGIGPMDLVTYEDARRYARRIREQVANKLMPPYYYDDDIGIQELDHDWRLSEEDIATVVAWVDQGSPLGDPADMPPPVDLSDTDDWSLASTLGQPDVVVPSTPIDVPAFGNDMWHRPFAEVGVTEDRCIRALQVKPAGDAKGVVHHANSTFQLQQDDGSFESSGDRATEYAMGKLGELIPDGVCRTLPADAWVRWDIHMYPGGLGSAAANDVLEDNVVELGIWLHPADYEYEYEQDLSQYRIRQGGELVMRPHGTAMMQGFNGQRDETAAAPARRAPWEACPAVGSRRSGLQRWPPRSRFPASGHADARQDPWADMSDRAAARSPIPARNAGWRAPARPAKPSPPGRGAAGRSGHRNLSDGTSRGTARRR